MHLIAHRGSTKNHPENSLAAIRQAARERWDGIEFDVRATRDRKFYILHDPLLLRTTSGWGRLSKKHSRHVRAVTLRNKERLPSLRDVLRALKNYRHDVYLEIKTRGDEQAIFDLVRRHPQRKRFVITQFDMCSLRAMRRIDPDIRLHFEQMVFRLKQVRLAAELGCVSIGMPVWSMHKSLVAEAHRLGLRVFAFRVRTRFDARRVKRLGVDGVFVGALDMFAKRERANGTNEHKKKMRKLKK